MPFSDALKLVAFKRSGLSPPLWMPALPVSQSTALTQTSFTRLADIGTAEPGNHFQHIYGLGDQVEILMSAVQAAINSDMRNRFHVLLWGEPGCGKTEIVRSLASMLTAYGVTVLSLDATTTTEAGIRRRFLEDRAPVPDVITFEEIEKVPQARLRWLLGIMDDRALLMQANFRNASSREVRALVVATANDLRRLDRMLAGALSSRFQVKLHCPRPSRELLARILAREVDRIGGSRRWVEPALAYCYDTRGISDPRTIIPVCLAGGNELMTGSYQDKLTATKGER